MPCQCGSAATVAEEARTSVSGCGCETESACACGSEAPGPSGSGTPALSERELKLERVVMELDKRLRRLEAAG